ncbi:methyltransferase domain-containing protein [Acetobacterium paludosum]|uniref:Methyltransferase domain-containing protein n=1 Tax=Acetobacterium paludosum TaxID=52693 RepID=A0A923HXQ1_9FIRM|nr:class I SAM-dependent methyltransferase [Acetobacterium paludosum]MBC3889062.1 methyltransferase domain-containing protein [Acetobacterium paludosum]
MELRNAEKLEDIRSYWNLRAPSFSKGNVEELNSESKKEWIQTITSFAPVPEYKKVLDIGCGPGFFSIMLAQAGYQVTAVDYTDNMLEEARKNAGNFGVEIEFLQMDAQNLTFDDGTFDFVISRNVTWNLEQPVKAYSEWLRVLRPNGRLLNNDGNYYYHYTDDFYNKAYSEKHQGHSHKVIDGVDTGVIDNIARELPLSKEMRPQWDCSILLGMGITDLSVKISSKEKAKVSDEEREIINKFQLFLVK